MPPRKNPPAPRKIRPGSPKNVEPDNTETRDPVEEMVSPAVDGDSSSSGGYETDEAPSPTPEKNKIDYEVLHNIHPNTEFEEAIKKRKAEERRVFETLIRDNVKMERDLKKQDESFNQLNAKYDVKCIELDALRSKTTELENKLADNEKQIRILTIRANKQTDGRRDPSNKASPRLAHRFSGLDGRIITDENHDSQGEKSDNNNDTSYLADAQDYETKIRDLQIRLMRLAEDDEEKSRRLSKLEQELEQKSVYTEALEGHVNEDTREDILKQMNGSKSDRGFETWGKQMNMVYVGKPQTYVNKDTYVSRDTKGNVKDSVVCVVS